MKKEISKIAYEKYQLAWMIQHGHSIDELLSILREAIEKNDMYDVAANTADFVEEYFEDQGFGGEMYVCYDEFLDAEYTDVQYIRQLLTKEEFVKYIEDSGYTDYDCFEVSEDRIVTITEYGYISEQSITDNPEETARIAQCRGAEFSLDDLTGDDDEDDDEINIILSEAKQWMGDYTNTAFFENIYEMLSEGVRIASYLDKDLQPGKYIWLQD